VAFNPKREYVFVSTKDASLDGWVEKKVPGHNYENANLEYDRAGQGPTGAPLTGAAVEGTGKRPGNVPCYRPPWAHLTAVNANTGEFAWQVPLGTNQNMPEGKRNVGGAGSSGPIVTAGGLVFVGAATDNRVRAYDSKTGKELWTFQLERQANAVPMTFQAKNGKQYVAVTAVDTLHVFMLP
jgi:quinoprotein glucose dehydrogenase